jgi:alpha-N-arabinofuranosidase
MRVAAGNGTSTGRIGFKNDGYFGMDVRPQTYTGSFWVKGAYNGTFTASLQSNLTSDSFGSVEVVSHAVANDWTEHVFELVPTVAAPSSNNTFSITFDPSRAAGGVLDFNLISLFPPTYKNRKNGLRIDLAEALADMNPVSDLTTLTILSCSNTVTSRASCAFLEAICWKDSPTRPFGIGKILLAH